MTRIHTLNLNLNKHNFIGLMLSSALMLALCSCGQGAGSVQTVHHSERNNIEEATLVSIDDSLPMLHDASFFRWFGDTLIINDHNSTDKVFHAYDIIHGKYLGAFGKFGAGPGELNNFGSLFSNPKNRNLYCINGGTERIVRFDVDSALNDSLYRPVDIVRVQSGSNGLFKHPYNLRYFNDSMLICCIKMHHPETHKLENYLGRLDMLTGESDIIGDIMRPVLGRNNNMTVSLDDSLIVMYSYDQDRIRLCNLDGEVFKIITGPNYSKEPSRGIEHFYKTTIGGDRLFAVYLNRPLIGKDKRSDIIVMDLEGNYLKTYRLYCHIWNMVYNESTHRLYVSTDGDPQFGYIQID